MNIQPQSCLNKFSITYCFSRETIVAGFFPFTAAMLSPEEYCEFKTSSFELTKTKLLKSRNKRIYLKF